MGEFWGRRTFCMVTGASQGIGRSFAVAFAGKCAPGSRVVLMARSTTGLEQTKALITASSPDVTVQIHSVDLSQSDVSVFKTILNHEDFREESYDLAMLVNNAGSIGKADLLTADMDDALEWNRYLSLNLFHVTALTAEFLRRFPPEGVREVCVVNVTSLCAVKPFKSLGYYCVGKAGREMFFKVLALENPAVNVLNYSPGPVDTDMVADLIKTVQDEETRKRFVTIRDKKELVTLEQTTQRVMKLLAERKYQSGDRVDYYDNL